MSLPYPGCFLKISYSSGVSLPGRLRLSTQPILPMSCISAAGTAVRFEPGQTRTVQLVALAGNRKVYGFRGLVQGAL